MGRHDLVEQRVLAFLARSEEPRSSGEVEWNSAAFHSARDDRQALRRLTARGQIARIVEAGRGRYIVGDRLFQRFIELRLAER